MYVCSPRMLVLPTALFDGLVSGVPWMALVLCTHARNTTTLRHAHPLLTHPPIDHYLQCFLTIGEQYNDALALAEEEGWALPNSEDSHRTALTALLSGQDLEDGAAGGVKEVHLPWKYLPGFWPVLWLAVVFVLHLLMVLSQHWSVAFRCLVRFRRVRDGDDPTTATHAMATPKPHCGNGKTLLVPVQPSPLGPAFEFHRRKYVYDWRSKTFVKIRCRVDRPLSFYRKWRGLPTEAAVESARLMYGTNRFEMEMPKFLDLYKAQLLSPFTIFQVSVGVSVALLGWAWGWGWLVTCWLFWCQAKLHLY